MIYISNEVISFKNGSEPKKQKVRFWSSYLHDMRSLTTATSSTTWSTLVIRKCGLRWNKHKCDKKELYLFPWAYIFLFIISENWHKTVMFLSPDLLIYWIMHPFSSRVHNMFCSDDRFLGPANKFTIFENVIPIQENTKISTLSNAVANMHGLPNVLKSKWKAIVHTNAQYKIRNYVRNDTPIHAKQIYKLMSLLRLLKLFKCRV